MSFMHAHLPRGQSNNATRSSSGAKPSDAQPCAVVSAWRRIMVLHLSATRIKIPVCSFFLYFLSTKRWNLFLISHNDFDDNLLVYF